MDQSQDSSANQSTTVAWVQSRINRFANQHAWFSAVERVMCWGPHFPSLPPSHRQPNHRLLQRRQWYLGQSLILLFFIMPDTIEREDMHRQAQELVDDFKYDAGCPLKNDEMYVDEDSREKAFYDQLCSLVQAAVPGRDMVTESRREKWLFAQEAKRLRIDMKMLECRLYQAESSYCTWDKRLDFALKCPNYLHSDATTHSGDDSDARSQD